MKYKVSKYVRIVNTDNYIYAYSFLAGNLLVIYNEYERSIFEAVLQGEDVEPCSFTDQLYQGYFVFKQDENEEELVEFLYHNNTHRSNDLTVILILSELCNFRCTYCYEEYDKHIMSDEIKDGTLSFIAKYVADNGIKQVTISWFGGEPSLFKEKVIGFMQELRHRLPADIMLSGFMTTNAFLLDRKSFEEYYEVGINGFQITVDGFSHTHNQLRPSIDGKETWQTIINNLHSISESWKADSFVLLRVNYNSAVYAELIEFFEYIKDTFQNKFTIHAHPISKLGELEKDSICDPVTIELAGTRIGEYFANNDTKTDFAQLRANLFGGVCYAAKHNSFLVDAHGCIRKCTVDLHNEENYVGQIHGTNDFSIDIRSLAKWVESQSHFPECESCMIYPVCMGRSCPLATLKKTSNCKTNKAAIYAFLDSLAERYYQKTIGYNPAYD